MERFEVTTRVTYGNRYRDYVDVVEAEDVLEAAYSEKVPFPHRRYKAKVISARRMSGEGFAVPLSPLTPRS